MATKQWNSLGRVVARAGKIFTNVVRYRVMPVLPIDRRPRVAQPEK